jgi:predicted ATP-dependent protease
MEAIRLRFRTTSSSSLPTLQELKIRVEEVKDLMAKHRMARVLIETGLRGHAINVQCNNPQTPKSTKKRLQREKQRLSRTCLESELEEKRMVDELVRQVGQVRALEIAEYTQKLCHAMGVMASGMPSTQMELGHVVVAAVMLERHISPEAMIL